MKSVAILVDSGGQIGKYAIRIERYRKVITAHYTAVLKTGVELAPAEKYGGSHEFCSHQVNHRCVRCYKCTARSPFQLSQTSKEDTLAAMRTASEPYKSVDKALADGYIRDPMNHCFEAKNMGMPPEVGVMGVHYFRPDLLGVTGTDPKVDGNGLHLDFMKPSILIYEPAADGSMQLVAVENLVFIKAWEAAGNSDRRRSSAGSGTPWRTIRPPRWTRRTASRRTTTSTCGSSATIRAGCSSRSTRMPPARTTWATTRGEVGFALAIKLPELNWST